MGESGSGGTSVGDGPPWLWISIGAALALVLYMVLGGKEQPKTSGEPKVVAAPAPVAAVEASPAGAPPAVAPTNTFSRTGRSR